MFLDEVCIPVRKGRLCTARGQVNNIRYPYKELQMKHKTVLWTLVVCIILIMAVFSVTCERNDIFGPATGEIGIFGSAVFGTHEFDQ